MAWSLPIRILIGLKGILRSDCDKVMTPDRINREPWHHLRRVRR